MAEEIIMPALGMAQDTGKLVAWIKHEGDTVKKGDPIFEVETDKVTVEIEAPGSGTLANITAAEGEDVPVGQVIALLLAPGEEAPEMSIPTASMPEPVAELAPPPPSTNGKSEQRYEQQPVATAVVAPSGVVLASPKARRLAKEMGLNLENISGTGPEGAVLANDVMTFKPSSITVSTAQPMVGQAVSATPVEISTAWRIMAERLTEAWQTIPHFILKREVDVTELVVWRERIKNRFETKVTYTDLLVKICAAALEQHPRANSSWLDGIVENNEVNVGLAVAVEDGLLVPVVHGANQMGLANIASRRAELVDRSLSNRLKLDDMQGGTFTISNLGMYGIDSFNAIVNPPQAAILAVGGIVQKYIVINGQPEVRPTMTLSLSCDHRVLDGARAAEFLSTIANYMEDPMMLLA